MNILLNYSLTPPPAMGLELSVLGLTTSSVQDERDAHATTVKARM